MILDPGFDLTLRPMKYPVFYDMYRDAIKNTWTVDEIDFSDDLVDLENRMFLNQIARLDCAGECSGLSHIELEPVPPDHPAPGMALATPYGIAVSGDDRIIVSVAASSSRLFTMDAESGAAAMARLLPQVPGELSAIYAINDAMAIGALRPASGRAARAGGRKPDRLRRHTGRCTA